MADHGVAPSSARTPTLSVCRHSRRAAGLGRLGRRCRSGEAVAVARWWWLAVEVVASLNIFMRAIASSAPCVASIGGGPAIPPRRVRDGDQDLALTIDRCDRPACCKHGRSTGRGSVGARDSHLRTHHITCNPHTNYTPEPDSATSIPRESHIRMAPQPAGSTSASGRQPSSRQCLSRRQ